MYSRGLVPLYWDTGAQRDSAAITLILNASKST